MSGETALKQLLVGALNDCLSDLDPEQLVRSQAIALDDYDAVLAVGKAGASMVLGLATAPHRPTLVVVPCSDNTSVPHAPGRIVLRSDHPRPGRRSLEAGHRARALFSQHERVLCLLSGGASALMMMPAPGLSARGKASWLARAMERGAAIEELNVLRKHLSAIKGGQLARGRRCHTLILSDVIGTGEHAVGSGPTLPDPTTRSEAEALLARYLPDVPEASARLVETPKQLPQATWEVLASPQSMAQQLATLLTRRGLEARALAPETGSVGMLAPRRIEQLRALMPRQALVIPCEPTIALPTQRGRGGRAGWIALEVLGELRAGEVFMAAATDGRDGTSSGAGAIVAGGDRLRADGSDRAAALERCDDERVHRALGTMLPGGATGTNLTDVHVVART